jgi:DNA-binding response OmpR family regulator
MLNTSTFTSHYLVDSFLQGLLEGQGSHLAQKNESKTILLVEDERYLLMAEARSLEMEGYQVVCAENGESAMEIIRKNDAVDLVLMDINLGTGIGGITAAQEILKMRVIPIVFLSSHIDEQIVKQTESVCSYGYVVKSCGLAVLSASIKVAFHLYNARSIIQQQKDEIEKIREELESSSDELEEIDDELLNQCAMLIDTEQKLKKSEKALRNRAHQVKR